MQTNASTIKAIVLNDHDTDLVHIRYYNEQEQAALRVAQLSDSRKSWWESRPDGLAKYVETAAMVVRDLPNRTGIKGLSWASSEVQQLASSREQLRVHLDRYGTTIVYALSDAEWDALMIWTPAAETPASPEMRAQLDAHDRLVREWERSDSDL